MFSPVTRVRYDVEETRVGQKTNYDKLTLEIWTDGSVGPEMALVEAAKILRKHLTPFVQYTQLGPAGARGRRGGGQPMGDAALESKLNMPLADLNLSVRASNCLESENIMTVRDLVTQVRRPVAGSPQLRRDDAGGSAAEAARPGPAPGHASARGRRGEF